ncbi:hypothetical protein A3B18_03045 [Candidatus Giovannonibacteria bacterium RIFCSPLOWO2_01_FULL_46_13]|uniref:Uncharacterized protein n=1 Tax=Candidatus Giovannonibacteria bacterium RIFCSPLOWO2_01_FULL_46_13 TaxID=1798352 RepID=A0A1F5X382_9BACT|nr:MAG: hypothetical protein A3B18_03045 [Candidatus Giovannonibacteria bacterium RIFCSPLOWO2_01_FULL_46_13]
MATLLDELAKKGLIAKDKEKKILERQRDESRRKEVQNSRELSSTHRDPSLIRLGSCPSIREFKAIAKDLLTEDPGKILAVINEAHRFKEESAGKDLLTLVYKVKDGLKGMDRGSVEKFLKRAFRRAGATLEKKDSKWIS